jgi:parvulin-like peptidyl-prolyl isomerase
LGSNTALVKFAFESGKSDISPVFKVPAGYVVATVSEIIKSGYKPFEEVSEAVKRAVIRKKKVDESISIANRIKEQAESSGDLSVAKSIFDKAVVSNAENFTASATIPGIGRDPAFAQAALNAELNEISEPVKSSRGSYLLKVTERTEVDSTLFNIQKNSLRDNLLTQKKNMIFSDWLAALKDDAEIEDDRHLFYR